MKSIRTLLPLLLLLGTLPSAAPAQAATISAAVSPSAVSGTVALGTRQTVTVTVSNTGDTAVTPALYTARPASNGQRTTAATRVPLPRQAAVLDIALVNRLAATPQQRTPFLVILRDQADLAAAYAITDWAARGAFVYRTLRDHANQTQAALRADLARRGLRATPYWIVNAVGVEGTLADARALAARAEVAAVRARPTAAVDPLLSATNGNAQLCSPDNPANPVCWNIRQIGADRVWRDFGVTGRGVTVANVDTGVRYTHPALQRSYRGYRAPGVFDNNYNWFDPQSASTEPNDVQGHGTHTMGTIVGSGDGTTDQPSVGVAPDASWIAAQGCKSDACSDGDLIASAQWLLAPTRTDGTDPRPDLRPMIVNNSWAGQGGDNWYASYTAAWRAAGMFPVFAAGNAGSNVRQDCTTIGSPADYADVLAVGATNASDRITNFSLLGPTVDGRTKPDLVAPGSYNDASPRVGILSTYYTAEMPYRALSGTSMATPHVAGAVALLWSANPALIGDYDATVGLLRATALPVSDTRCGDPSGSPNSVYGSGRIDVYAAVARTRVSVPWLTVPATIPALAPGESVPVAVGLNAALVPGPGTYRARVLVYGPGLGSPLASATVEMVVPDTAPKAVITGRVTSARSGGPLAATVAVSGGLGVSTDQTGAYTLTVALGTPAATLPIVASARAFFSKTENVPGGADRRVDFVLESDQPQIVMTTAPLTETLGVAEQRAVQIPIRNGGTRPLNYSISVPPDRFSVQRSDAPGGAAYQWIELPANAPRVNFGTKPYSDSVKLGIDFPFYGYVLTDTLVTAQGLLSFALPIVYDGQVSGCLPDSSLVFYTLAPFRANLDPARGSLRYGVAPDGQAFVLTYQDVAARGAPAGATSTFQVLLRTDGRITYQYQSLASPLPTGLSVGVQRTPLDYMSEGCNTTLRLAPGLAITYTPQPSTSFWLTAAESSGTVPPGQELTATLTIRWLPPTGTPFAARVVITSTDPYSARLERRVVLVPRPAPIKVLLFGGVFNN